MVFRRHSILRRPSSKKSSRPKTRLSVMPLEDRTLLSGGSLAALLQQGYIGPQPTPDQLQALSSDPSSQALHTPPLGVVTVAAALPPSNSPLNATTFRPSAGAGLGSGNDDGPSHGPAFANG